MRYSTFIHIQIYVQAHDIHKVMCCGQGDFRTCINLNFEPVHWEMARMSMSCSLFLMSCVCHLVALPQYVTLIFFFPFFFFTLYQFLSNSVPLQTWGLREGAQRHLSQKCRVNTTTTHMGQLERRSHLSLQSSLCPTTQVSV